MSSSAKPSAAEHAQPGQTIRVWDPLVRLFHWALVACVLLNFAVLEEGETWHEWVGYTASALVGLRLLWGLVGTRHARFADWFPTPARLQAHVAALMRGEAPRHVGHNPLGALMMLVLMALVLGLGLTGWWMESGALEPVLAGVLPAAFELDEVLEELHEGLANALMLAAGLHAAAALLMGRLERVNLVQAMWTGRKRFR